MSEEDIERVLTTLVRRVNGTDPAVVDPERLDADALLYEDLDVDSLAKVELAELIEERFAIPVPEDDILGLKTFGALTGYVRSALK